MRAADARGGPCLKMAEGGAGAGVAALAPVVSEVLYGGTRISFIFALIPEIGAWGCGALLIRWAVRRWRRGWVSLLLLGLALAVAEECLIQQTSLAPMVGLAKNEYGRAWGVNWIYFLWALGYESVWVVLVPVQLVELIFRERRGETWFGRRGLIRAGVSFGIASFMAWFMWTRSARPKLFHMPPYDPPVTHVLLALGTIALLIVAAFVLPPTRENERAGEQRVVKPWVAGTAVFIFGVPWGAFVLLGFGVMPQWPAGIVFVAGTAWAAVAFLIMKRWISNAAWGDAHRFAVVLGGVLACMVSGFVVFQVGGALRADWIGKAVLDAAALVGLIFLGRRIWGRKENL